MKNNKYTKRTLYILTEGHTEEAYFSRMSEIMSDEDEWKYSVTIQVREIVDGSKTDPLNMVKEAKKSQKNYDEVWVVFDKDRDRDTQNLQAIELASKSKINIAFSSISFESWVLLHFEKFKTNFERSDCESRGSMCNCNGDICISTYIKLNYYQSYQKGKSKLYDELYDKLDIALEFSAWLRCHHEPLNSIHVLNPFTDIDRLISLLLSKPIIRYSKSNNSFVFEEVSFSIINYEVVDNALFNLRLDINNKSTNLFLLNNQQENIKLVDLNNKEYKYQIAQTKIINTGESFTLDIQFAITVFKQPFRLKFESITECVFIEL